MQQHTGRSMSRVTEDSHDSCAPAETPSQTDSVESNQARRSQARPVCSNSVPSRPAQRQRVEPNDRGVKRQLRTGRHHHRLTASKTDQARRSQARPVCSSSVPSRPVQRQQSEPNNRGVKRQQARRSQARPVCSSNVPSRPAQRQRSEPSD